MVVLSAVATVEVQLPRHEVEEIACRLRASYNELMSDRAGQEALNRLLRQQSSQLKQEQRPWRRCKCRRARRARRASPQAPSR